MRLLEEKSKETLMAVFMVHVCMFPERYFSVQSLFACHSLQHMTENVHIVGLGLWHSVVFYVASDVSVEHATAIIKDETTAILKIQL
jgi:hypothetical protein